MGFKKEKRKVEVEKEFGVWSCDRCKTEEVIEMTDVFCRPLGWQYFYFELTDMCPLGILLCPACQGEMILALQPLGFQFHDAISGEAYDDV